MKQKIQLSCLIILPIKVARWLDALNFSRRVVHVDDHSLVWHTLRENIRASGTIRDAEESLAGTTFFRCNKGYLVNLAHVDSIAEDDAVVRGERLQVSRSRKRAFLDALNRYINEAE